MLKRLGFYFVAATLLATFATACNSSETDDNIAVTVEYTNTQISTFALAENDSVLVNLDSIFFSIDQHTGNIFNADSLPKGTNVSELIVSMTLPSSPEPSKVEITYSRAGLADTTINFQESAYAPIDFSVAPARVHVVAADGKTERDYYVKVNVHQIEPDSLFWDVKERRPLPYTGATPRQQRTVKAGSYYYCATTANGTALTVAKLSSLEADAESYTTVTPAFAPKLSSLTGTPDGSLYMLADDTGDLYASADGGDAWSATGTQMTTIYGVYGNHVVGLDRQRQNIITYPATTVTPLPEGFPVEGINSCLDIDLEWMGAPEIFITGGIDIDGNYLNATWAYDGTQWMKMANRPLPQALANVTLVPYYNFIINENNWSARKLEAFLAIGGEAADGTLNATTYISYDYGLNWIEGGDLLQLPDYIGALQGAQAFIEETTFTDSRSGGCWETLAGVHLPAWYIIETAPESRATKPITSWQCPYIYLVGGYDANGALSPYIWRGVINRLTFKPIQ